MCEGRRESGLANAAVAVGVQAVERHRCVEELQELQEL